jgi:uncharacterized protein (DUF2141 family)
MRTLIAAALCICTFTIVPVSAQTVAPAPMQSQAQSKLTLTFVGVEVPKGVIMIALYDAAGWTDGKPVRVAVADASAAKPSTVIANLPAGSYGAKLFHDIDGDGKLGVNPFGIPTEPFAFSNDAKGVRGPASWDDAKFSVGSGPTAQTITIR